jgi:hypothetical protein
LDFSARRPLPESLVRENQRGGLLTLFVEPVADSIS